MIASATFSFSPAIPGGNVTVTNKATETDVKVAVQAVLATRKAAAQGDVTNLESAESAMGG